MRTAFVIIAWALPVVIVLARKMNQRDQVTFAGGYFVGFAVMLLGTVLFWNPS